MDSSTIRTDDGSKTLYSSRFNAHYHSVMGALQESRHVFIEAGLEALELKDLRLFEMGFGTGLNAALANEWAEANERQIHYHAFELFPVDYEWLLNQNIIEKDSVLADFLREVNCSEWNRCASISEHFCIEKEQKDLSKDDLKGPYDCIFYDAFAPRSQPELWTIDIFSKLYEATAVGGVFVTYCAKGQVRRDLIEAGWLVERIVGPPGKREMLRGFKR